MSVEPTAGPGFQAPMRPAPVRLALDLERLGAPALLLIYVLFLPIGPALISNPDVTGYQNPLVDVVWGMGRHIMAALIPLLILLSRTGARPIALTLPLWPYCLYVLSSILWSASPKDTWHQAIDVPLAVMLISTLVYWRGAPAFVRTSQILSAGVMICSVIVAVLPPHIGVHHASDAFEPVHAGRWRGLFIHKNVLGGLAAVFLPVQLRSVRSETRQMQVFFWIGRLSTVLCLVMARSASGLSSAAVCLLTMTMLSFKPTSKPVFLIPTVLIAGLLSQGLAISVGSIAELLGRDPTLTGRTQIWALAWTIIRQKPLIGHGYATDTAVFGAVGGERLFASASHTHSGYLEILLETGAIGFLIFACTLGYVLFQAYRTMLRSEGPLREAFIIYISVAIGACLRAYGEPAPFHVLEDGVVGLWTALPLLQAQSSMSAAAGRLRKGLPQMRISGASP